MDVGRGCTISDEWIPVGIATGITDIDGNPLETANQVKLTGCTSRHAFVGRSMSGKFVLYFGSDHGSVQWNLDVETITKHNVRLCNGGDRHGTQDDAGRPAPIQLEAGA